MEKGILVAKADAEEGSMRKLILKPNGWECELEECPAGLFVFQGEVGLKTEYRIDSEIEAFCESGETFIGGCISGEERERLFVQPVIADWVDEEE